MTAQKNIFWINAVKTFAILGVFLFHVEQIYGYSLGKINDFIAPWYVNSFFFISGYLLFRKQLSFPIVEQSKQLYINRLANGGGVWIID